MKSLKRFFFTVFLIFLISLGLVLSGWNGPKDAEAKFKVVIAVGSEAATLDVHNEPSTNLQYNFQIFNSLVERGNDLKTKPALAKAWKPINDTTWEFKLREGVTFHNGDEFTAEDVKFSLDRIMSAGATSGPRKEFAGWLKEVIVVDKYMVRLVTNYPYPLVLARLGATHWVIPKKYFQQVGKEGFAKRPIGTGPFRFVNWSINEKLELEAFDNYWAGRPEVDKLIFRVIPDKFTRIAALLTGEVDIVLDVPVERVEELRKKAGIIVKSTPSISNTYVGFNTFRKPFDNVLVRRAINHAVDVDMIIKEVLGGYAKKANCLVNSTSFGWNPEIKRYEYDPKRAKELLAQAGFKRGFKTTVEVGPGVWPKHKEIAEAILGYLKGAGIDADLRVRDWADYFDRYRGTKLAGIFLWGKFDTKLDCDDHLHLNFVSPGKKGRGLYWNSEETDKMIIEARSSLDPNRRKELYFKVQEIIHDQAVGAPLWEYHEVVGMRSNIDWAPRGDTHIRVFTVKRTK